MIEIKTHQYITTDDVEKLTGKHWGDFEFAQMAENDSYQIVALDDDTIEDLEEDIAYETELENAREIDDCDDYEIWHRSRCRLARLKNQLELVNILRKDYGLRESILIWVCW